MNGDIIARANGGVRMPAKRFKILGRRCLRLSRILSLRPPRMASATPVASISKYWPTMASKIRRCRLSARAAQSLPTLRSRAERNQTPGVFTRVGLPSYLAWYTWRRVSLQAERVDLPMTIRRRSNFEARQLVLFGAATIVLLVFTWTYVH